MKAKLQLSSPVSAVNQFVNPTKYLEKYKKFDADKIMMDEQLELRHEIELAKEIKEQKQ